MDEERAIIEATVVATMSCDFRESVVKAGIKQYVR